MSSTPARLISTESLTKVYHPGRPDEVRAVDAVTMHVDRGEVVVLKGPSGSGKTSLLSLMGCMARPTSGRLVVADRDVAKLPEWMLTEVRRSLFGFVFQQYNLITDLSVLENVMLPLYPTGVGLAEMRQRAEVALKPMGLGDKALRRVSRLSGGEQQRVAVARALVNRPEVVVADEPTAHLDRQLSLELLQILEELKLAGKTIVIATHDELVFDHPMVSRVLEMRDGRMLDGAGS